MARKTSKKTKVKPPFFYKTDWLALAGLIAFAIAALLTRPETATAFEEAIFFFFYAESGVLVPIFFVLTQLGSVYFYAVLATIFLFFRSHVILIRLLMAGALAYMLAGVGKDLFGRGRPDELFGNVIAHDAIRGPGFPSGHSAMAVALGTVLYLYSPRKWRPLIVIVTVLAAVSRMVVGVHTPLDIVGGVALGWFAAFIFERVEVRAKKA